MLRGETVSYSYAKFSWPVYVTGRRDANCVPVMSYFLRLDLESTVRKAEMGRERSVLWGVLNGLFLKEL